MTMKKLTDELAVEIRLLHKAKKYNPVTRQGLTYDDLATLYNISWSTVKSLVSWTIRNKPMMGAPFKLIR